MSGATYIGMTVSCLAVPTRYSCGSSNMYGRPSKYVICGCADSIHSIQSIQAHMVQQMTTTLLNSNERLHCEVGKEREADV